MARQTAYRISTGAWLVASAVAPVLATVITLVLLFALDVLPFIIETAHADPATQRLFGFTSLRAELSGAIATLLKDILLSPTLSLPLGFVGACLFLLPAFLFAEGRPTARTFILVGAGAGLTHAVSGIALAGKDGLAVWIGLALGYFPYGGTPLARILFGVGAVVAGATVGKLYWRLRS